jgi:hypothetical protein
LVGHTQVPDPDSQWNVEVILGSKSPMGSEGEAGVFLEVQALGLEDRTPAGRLDHGLDDISDLEENKSRLALSWTGELGLSGVVLL